MDFNEFYLTKDIPSSILLEGEDEFLQKIAIKKLKKAYKIEDLDVTEFDKDALIEQVSTSLDTIPFLSEKRLVIVREFYPKSKQLDGLNFSNNSILLVCNKQKSEPLKKVVEISVDCSKCESFVKNYLSSKFKKANIEIEKVLVDKIIDFCSLDAFRCDTETDKLISFCSEKHMVESEDIDQVVTPDFDYKIYELTEYIATKKTQKAYLILQDMLNKNEPSHKLFISVYNHFRRLFYCKLNSDAYELSEILSIKEFAVKKAQAMASRFTANELKNINSRFAEYDHMVKSGKMDILNALWLSIFQISKL